MVSCLFAMCNTEALFTKSVPSTMKMTVKGGAAVDPDSGIAYFLTYSINQWFIEYCSMKCWIKHHSK